MEEGEGGEGVWVCSCPLCRLLINPLLKGIEKPKPGGENREGEGGVVEMSEGEEKKSADIGATGSRESEELRELIETLRESIVDLKSVLMDLSNPIGRLRGREVREEEREEREEEEKEHEVPPLSASAEIMPRTPVVIERMQEARRRESRKEVSRGKSVEEEVRGAGEIEAKAEEERRGVEKKITVEAEKVELKKVARILRLLHKLAEKIPSESIDYYIKLIQVLGVADSKSIKIVKSIKKIVESGLRTGLSPEDQLIAIYGLAKALGVNDPEFENEVLLLMIDKIRGGGGAWELQRQ